jgi:hypothetical protein
MRLFALAMLVGLLAGCQEGENVRPVSGEKGVYSGKVDETLSEDTRQQLRQRMNIQRAGSI